MKSLLQNLTVVAVALLGCALVLEALLRLFPGVITVADLAHFPSLGLRSELAAARGLPTSESVVRLERPDGGPEVLLPAGSMSRPVDPVDLEHGATATEFRTGGFCNSQPPDEIEPQIVAVGDSFTYCTNVALDRSWVYLLGAQLGKETLNLGMPGQGLYEYRDALRTQTATTRLETVVVAIYEGNDVRDGLGHLRYFERGGDTDQVASENGNSGDAWLIRHSWFLNALIAKIEILADDMDWFSDDANFHYTVQTPDGPVDLNVGNSDQDEIHYSRQYRSGELGDERLARLFAEPMEQIADWTRARGAGLLFVYLPSAHSAYGARTTFADPEIGELVGGFSRHQRGLFAEICAEAGYDCLDMTTRFNARVSTSPLAYFPANVHLTPEGHKIVAEEVARHLVGR